MKTLQEWLDWCEQLHPVTIDMGLDRVKTVAERMALRFDCPVITVAGTNGKGSTCAMLEAVLLQAGYRTGVYTSPHLVHFEERCRLHGESASAEAFAEAFAAVEAVRGDVSLTYFEFSTLAILHLMAQSHLDVAILEVGLGGRLDAVNIIDADCAVITSIDLDHMAILGNDRERIGFEKAGIMRAGRPVIVSDPVPPQSVIDHAAAIGAELRLFGRDFNFSGDKQQWAWAGRDRRYSGMAYPALRGANQLINASGVLAALESLRQRIPITAQAVRNGLAISDRARAAGFGAGCGTQPPLGGRAGGQLGRHGLLSHHPRCVWGHGRQGPVAHAAKGQPDGGQMVFHRFALAPCRQSDRFAARLAGTKHPHRHRFERACRPHAGPACGH
jgi:dihydrofolate synthase/folylpolyglutamate synthase